LFVDLRSVGPRRSAVVAAERYPLSPSEAIFGWLLRAMPCDADWRTVRPMRALHLVRDHANLAFAAFCTLAIQIEVWFAGYATHRPLLSVLCLLTTVPIAFRSMYPLVAYVIT
jgi:hypothetical protein